MKVVKEDFFKKYKKLSGLNESATITAVPDEDDNYPIGMVREVDNPAQNQNNPEDQQIQAPAETQPQQPEGNVDAEVTPDVAGTPQDSPEAAFDQESGFGQGDAINPVQGDQMATDTVVSNPEEKEQDIQNELLRIQVSAMRKMSDKITELESLIDNVNKTIGSLAVEVEKVREPEPTEKLEKKWQDSYPFKYTLNDLWNGNAFQGRQDLYNDPNPLGSADLNGQKTANGEHVIPYDNIPKLSDFELKKSFEVYS